MKGCVCVGPYLVAALDLDELSTLAHRPQGHVDLRASGQLLGQLSTARRWE